MKYLMKLSNQYEIEASSEDEALEKLGDYLDSNNMTAETEFWESIDVVMIDVENDTEGTECPHCGWIDYKEDKNDTTH